MCLVEMVDLVGMRAVRRVVVEAMGGLAEMVCPESGATVVPAVMPTRGEPGLAA